MADKPNELVEKIRALLGDEAAAVTAQYQDLTAKVEKAKTDLATTEAKNAEAVSASETQVSGLTTRLAEVERRERDATTREETTKAVLVEQQATAHGLGLREQALVPQETAVRQKGLELTDQETSLVADATELKELRDKLLTQATVQATKADELTKRETAIEEAKAILKEQAKTTKGNKDV